MSGPLGCCSPFSKYQTFGHAQLAKTGAVFHGHSGFNITNIDMSGDDKFLTKLTACLVTTSQHDPPRTMDFVETMSNVIPIFDHLGMHPCFGCVSA